MFFRKKGKKDAATVAADIRQSLGEGVKSVVGTAPEIVEERAEIPAQADFAAESTRAVEETVEAGIVSPSSKESASFAASSTDIAPSVDGIRLFPGFERDDFEVGFRAGNNDPALVMRWKDGGEWFCVPALFNRAVLAAMDERDSASDLNRLLRNYGYDVESIAE